MVMADDRQMPCIADEGPIISGSDNLEKEEFTCSQCLEEFEDRSSLFKHVHARHKQHVHSRRKFRCDRCERTFKSMTGLRNHARTHQGFFVFSLDTNLDASVFSQPSITATEDDNDKELIHSSLDTDERDSVLERINSVDPADSERDNNDIRNKVNESVTEDSKFEEHGMEATKALSRPTDNVNLSENESVISGSSHNRKSERRRSGIPVPVRRSLYIERELTPGQNDYEIPKLMDQSTTNGTLERIALSCTNTKDLSSSVQIKKELASKCLRQSPFGKKYKTKAPCPLTPSRSKGALNSEQNGSPLRKRTPIHKTRTPKSIGKCTNYTGSITPQKNRSTPKQLTPRNIFTTSSNSAKKSRFEGEMFICKKCGKSFVDRAKLNVHFAVHSRETPEKCGIEKRLVKRNMAAQMTAVSPFVDKVTSKTLSCQKCDQKFENEALLNDHVKSHGVETFCCPHCEKKFRYQASLKAHSFVHQGEVTGHGTDESMCKDRAPENGNEIMETRSHKHDKLNIFSLLSESGCSDDCLPFACKSCKFSTHLPADLLVHMKTHSRQGPYTCKQCQKSYKHQSNLHVHEKIHTINKIKNIILKNKEIKQRV